MELDTTKNLTKISNKDGAWFSEHSLETVKSVWKKKEGLPVCGMRNQEILIDDGRCIDCIEEQKFYEMTMKGI